MARIDPIDLDLPELADLNERLALSDDGKSATSESNDLEP